MLHPTENQSLVLLVPLLERVQWSCLRFRPQRNQSPVDILPRSVHRVVLEETVRTLSSRSGRPHLAAGSGIAVATQPLRTGTQTNRARNATIKACLNIETIDGGS